MPSTTFIPSTSPHRDSIIANDGWYPNISLTDFRAATGLGTTFGPAQVEAVVRASMIETNASIAEWRSRQSAATLADVPSRPLGNLSEKTWLYTQAVYNRARAQVLAIKRDYDATKDGHAKADLLEGTVDTYLRCANEALSRLTNRPRTTVELI